MGYCPFEHKAGRAGGTSRQGAGAWGVGARHNAQRLARGAATRPAGRPRHGHCAWPGHACVQAGRASWVSWAVCVHTVHLTSF